MFVSFKETQSILHIIVKQRDSIDVSESQVLPRAGSVIPAVWHIGLTPLNYKLHDWFYGGNSTLIRSFFLKLNLLTLLRASWAWKIQVFKKKWWCFLFTSNFLSPIKTTQPLRKAHFLLWIKKGIILNKLICTFHQLEI